MQTQEDHSNPIPALNVDSLKVDLVAIQNTCSEKEDGNSENASSKSMHMQESKIDTGKAVDADFVVTESSGTESEVQDDSSRSRNDTDADDANIRPIYDEEPMAEYPKQCQVKRPMLDSSPDNQTTDYSKQSLESENILLKKTVAQFQKDFSRMEAHCIALELKYQNQALKSGQHGQILNETSNKAKIKKEIDVLETMNIELEHSVAKLRKENETLKKHYKDLYDSIKITRSKTIEQTTSLLANNADLKAQIQEKVFAIAALKNDLRKLKGNSVDTKSYALSWKPCQGDSLNLPDHRIHKDGDGDASFQLKSDSLPHAHAQTTKTFYKHQDSRIMKAQELKTKTSAQTLIYKIFLQRYQVYQGRLLASFQDDAKSCKVRVGSNGNLLWEASVLLGRKKGGVRVERKDDRGVSEGREDVRDVFQQRGSGAKRKLSRCGRNQMGNELIMALPKGADDFIVYYDARSKDLEACLEKGEEIESGSYWLDKVRTSIWRDVRTLAIEEAYTTKYSIHPGADTMLCGFRLTNRWLSMKKDIASCGSKYLAYSEVEVEYQGSSGLLLQPELPE
ncbi:hypothetical protein Tco_1375632 [Tanacetum coccineum]